MADVTTFSICCTCQGSLRKGLLLSEFNDHTVHQKARHGDNPSQQVTSGLAQSDHAIPNGKGTKLLKSVKSRIKRKSSLVDGSKPSLPDTVQDSTAFSKLCTRLRSYGVLTETTHDYIGESPQTGDGKESHKDAGSATADSEPSLSANPQESTVFSKLCERFKSYGILNDAAHEQDQDVPDRHLTFGNGYEALQAERQARALDGNTQEHLGCVKTASALPLGEGLAFNVKQEYEHPEAATTACHSDEDVINRLTANIAGCQDSRGGDVCERDIDEPHAAGDNLSADNEAILGDAVTSGAHGKAPLLARNNKHPRSSGKCGNSAKLPRQERRKEALKRQFKRRAQRTKDHWVRML
ncbi:hypothetical protein MTO96_036105 [Rhipicephalus appendiculatus]